MTEDKAKKKWCPMRHVTGDGSYGCMDSRGNTNAEVHKNCGCLGSGCMAWRWVMEADRDERGYVSGESETDEGFCGLARKP